MTLSFVTYASLSGVLKLILIMTAVYFLYSLLIRFIIPSVVKNQLNKFQQRFYEQNPNFTKPEDRKKEGEVTIKYMDRDKNNKKDDSDSEYIDYEEIK